MGKSESGNGKSRVGSGGFKSSRGKRFGELVQVFDDIWWAWGTVRFGPGFSFPRNMFIIRDGDALTVVHPVLMPEPVQAEIEKLGEIKNIVRLGAFHGMDDPLYIERYKARYFAPPGVDVAEGVSIDVELTGGGELPVEGAELFEFEAARAPEAALRLDRHGGILVTCDSVQNWVDTEGCSFLGGIGARLMGFRGPACIGPGWRKFSEPKDGTGFGPAFEKLLEWDFKHLLAAHGRPLEHTAKADLRRSVERLYG